MFPTLNGRTGRLFRMAMSAAAASFAFGALQAEAGPSGVSEIEERNKSVVRSGFEAWQAGTGSPFDLLTEDARWTIEGYSVASRTYPNKEDFLREVIRPFNARMKTPLKPTVRNLYAEGDTVVVLFDAVGTACDGKPYANTYAWFLDLRAGRIVKGSAFFDSIEFNDLWARIPVAN